MSKHKHKSLAFITELADLLEKHKVKMSLYSYTVGQFHQNHKCSLELTFDLEDPYTFDEMLVDGKNFEEITVKYLRDMVLPYPSK